MSIYLVLPYYRCNIIHANQRKKGRKNPENATHPTGQGNSVENREQVTAVET
jgi:hypothetical protein